jgi:hypothetical protein
VFECAAVRFRHTFAEGEHPRNARGFPWQHCLIAGKRFKHVGKVRIQKRFLRCRERGDRAERTAFHQAVQHHLRSGRARLGGECKHQPERLGETFAVGADLLFNQRGFDMQRYMPRARQTRACLQCALFHQVPQCERRTAERQRPSLGSGRIDELLDHLHLLFHAGTNPAERALGGGIGGIDFALQHVTPAMDGVQRTAQIMRHNPEHVITHEQRRFSTQMRGALIGIGIGLQRPGLRRWPRDSGAARRNDQRHGIGPADAAGQREDGERTRSRRRALALVDAYLRAPDAAGGKSGVGSFGEHGDQGFR